MPLIEKFTDCDATTGIWKIDESLAELEALYTIKPTEWPVYMAFKNDRRRKEWLSTRILLRQLVGYDVQICYRDSGKPYLSDLSACISITHTVGFVGIRLASHPVALDMEYRSDRVLKILDRFVSEKEMKYIDPEEPTTSALIIWSAKETLFKLFDFHDVLFDQHLFISNLRLRKSGHFRGTMSKGGFEAYVRLYYKVLGDLILVYC